MARPRQLQLSPAFKPRTEHGGSLRAGRRKLARPIDPKRSMHIVFRSTRAVGRQSLLHPVRVKEVRKVFDWAANRFQVEIQQYANAGNHVHIAIRGKTRKGIQNFLRTVGSKVAILVTGARKGTRAGKFWDALAYSKVISGWKELLAVRGYIRQNELEVTGTVPYRPRRRKPPPRVS